MASVTYDGRSFMLDGRRVWIVGGSIHYARLPREDWADRIAAAKQAGLNTIETPIVWSRHESRPGQFDFEGDNDIRHFVKLAGEAGMHVVLRVGPFVGSGYDAGGIPAWLLAQKEAEPRAASGPFLEACSRYITALAEQIKDLQVTSTGRGGPVLLVQSEHAWTCGNDVLAKGYLGELLRYLRESGIGVPVINANGLWQSVEGEIECWTGVEDLLSISRQLVEVKPRLPRVVADFRVGEPTTWGEESPVSVTPNDALRAAAESLAGVSQFVINPFAGGQSFGFLAGRMGRSGDAFLTSRQDNGALVSATGERTDSYGVMRRITMFAGRFGRVLAHLDPDDRPVVLAPTTDDDGPTVVPTKGTQGSVVFVFGKTQKRSKAVQQARLLLRDGSTLEVPVGPSGTTWCLFDTLLDGRSTLDYSSLAAFASVGSVFVCFGPTGSEGTISINGSPLEVTVPGGKKPDVIEHEGITVVVASEDHLDTVHVTDDAVYFEVAGFDASGGPIATPGGKQYTRIGPDGKVERLKADTATRKDPGSKTVSIEWETADTALYSTGESPRYAAIEGPADLTTLGAPYGYGWYRLSFRSAAAKRVKIAAPASADRLHLFLDGEPIGILGKGPGAEVELLLPLRKADHNLIVLAENFGRPSGGLDLRPRKGLFGDLYELSAFKAGRSKTVEAAPIDLFSYRAPLWEVREGDVTHPDRVSWTFVHRRKSPIVVRFDAIPVRALVVLNDQPIHLLEPGSAWELMLDHETLNRGNNTFDLAVLEDSASPEDMPAVLQALSKATNFFEGKSTIANKIAWAFAQWETPAPTEFDDLEKPGDKLPRWYSGRFDTPEGGEDLLLEPGGLTKGQVYLNGRHIGRFFSGTGGKPVAPGGGILLPGAWLKESGENELMIFDEEGGEPSRAKLHTARGA